MILGTAFGSAAAFAHSEDAPHGSEQGESDAPNDGAMPGTDRITLGATVYKHMCTFCHGADGNGGGKAMAYLYPWPRDFRKGVFKFRSTPQGSLPLDADIYRTISRGVPGTAMPAWENALTEEEIWSVVQYIKGFSERFKNEVPKPAIRPGSTPPATPEAIASGQKLYAELRCARCHGTDLKGEGALADQLYDIWDHRVFVYDLTNPNTYKFGYETKDIYMTLTTGIDGTPMKTFSHLNDEERWDIAALVRSKLEMDKLEEAKFETDLHATKIDDEIVLDPGHELWEKIPERVVHLLPLNARKKPVNQIKIRSVINEEAVAFRLEWEDPVPNRSSSRHQDFKDAVAMEFALGDVLLHKHGHNEPFFGMGNRGKVVNIWQWRADWQTEIETKEKLEYATKGMDLDAMIFGGEVNPVDALNPFRDVPVEEMNAEGFGTLTPQPQTKQNVLGKGVWKDGRWSVVFYRTLDSLNKWDKQFENDRPVLVAFAIWDGSHQDRNGRKVVSMWQRLHLP
ncbi:nitrite oxidoreductase, gamma subunit (modular protein) [Candidatus Nitromaritima sp. SCGC AAA799-A02]|nr:nitrite oxidoreductase, gamma subunit (modular protein) [Candidatus Nitromaritima sp. SCGC AAA799-A02]KMP10384.1 nitrite oxidoreductase, gamma subunit (modular protein) [Candidatus Nitromaritima sp. SCGC AAA799-C22]